MGSVISLSPEPRGRLPVVGRAAWGAPLLTANLRPCALVLSGVPQTQEWKKRSAARPPKLDNHTVTLTGPGHPPDRSVVSASARTGARRWHSELAGRLRLPESLVAVPEEAVPAGEKLLRGKVRFGLRCVSVNPRAYFYPLLHDHRPVNFVRLTDETHGLSHAEPELQLVAMFSCCCHCNGSKEDGNA